MAVNLTNLTTNVNNIQNLSDKPNETDGLTAQGLKEKFDKAGNDIKNYINGTLIEELEEVLSSQEITNTTISGEINELGIRATNLETRATDLEDINNYSLEEQTIGKWIDGTTLYRKVVYVGNLGNNATKLINHNINNIGTVIKGDMFWYDTTDARWYFKQRIEGTPVRIDITVNQSQVIINGVGFDWTGRTRDCYVILEYTKKQD